MIRRFEYGDVPGYASITIAGSRVQAAFQAGLATESWRTLDLVAWRDTAVAGAVRDSRQ